MELAYHRLASGRGWWRPLVEFLLAFAFWVIGLLIAAAAAADLDLLGQFVAGLVGIAAMLPGCLLAARIMGRRPGLLSSVIGRIRWRWLLWCTGVITILIVVAAALAIALYLVLDLPLVEEGTRSATTPPLWLMIVAIVPFTPLQAAGEEYLFRGTLLQMVGAWSRFPWLAIVITSVLFALAHMTGLAVTLMLIASALITGWLTVRTGGLEAAIAEHTIMNILAFVGAAIEDPDEMLSAVDLNADVPLEGIALQLAILIAYAAIVVRRHTATPPRPGFPASSTGN